jgi:hypothetical protein
MTPEIISRSTLASAAGLLLAGTLIILVDIRIDQFDILADAVGAALVLIAVLRIRSSIRGADATHDLLVVLALVGLAAGVIDTVSVNTLIGNLLATAQIIGAMVLANLLARAFASTERELSATWGLTCRLILWLGVVPVLIVGAISLFNRGVHIETALVIPLLLVLAVPLIYLLMALSRTMKVPAAGTTVPPGLPG